MQNLIKHFGGMYRDLCFVLDLIQIIIDIVTLGYKPNIDLKLHKTFLLKFLQSRMGNDGVRTLSKHVVIIIPFRLKSHEMDSPSL
jgi:hypothetical protein